MAKGPSLGTRLDGEGVDRTAGSPFKVYEFCLEGKIGLGLAKGPSLRTGLDGAGVDGTADSPFEVYTFCLEGKIGLGLAKRPSLGTRLDGAEAAKLGATSLGSVYCESD